MLRARRGAHLEFSLATWRASRIHARVGVVALALSRVPRLGLARVSRSLASSHVAVDKLKGTEERRSLLLQFRVCVTCV